MFADSDNRVIGHKEMDTHRSESKVQVVARQQDQTSPATERTLARGRITRRFEDRESPIADPLREAAET
jgi:hypothetical protein